MTAEQTCLQGFHDYAGQTPIPGGGSYGQFCFLSSREYLYETDIAWRNNYPVFWDDSYICNLQECLVGLVYSMDIGFYGPFFYSLRHICANIYTGAKREVPYTMVADVDWGHPTYRGTPQYQAEIRVESKTGSCWRSKCCHKHHISC